MNKLTKDTIEKFLKGETSIAEEKEIQRCFLSDNIDEEHFYLLPYFKHGQKIGDQEIEIDIRNIINKSVIQLQKKNTHQIRRLMPYAAMLLIMIGVSSALFLKNGTNTDNMPQKDMDKVTRDAEYALLFLAKKMNTGSEFFELKNEHNEAPQ